MTGLVNSPPAPTTKLNWPPIPAWEITSLQNLSDQGKLYGIPPQILAYIDSAESSGNAGGSSRSPTGYGGWFGLHDNVAYPGGKLTPAELSDTSPAGFALQAQIAASEFASLLTKNGNDPVKAEQAYQGSTTGDGTRIFQQYLGGTKIQPGAGPAGGTGAAGSTSNAGTCDPTVYLINASPFHLINQCQAQEILGALLMGVGGLALVVGFGIVLADVGLRKSAPAIVGAVIGRRSGERSAQRSSERRMSEREQASGLRTQEREHSASARTYARGTKVTASSAADKRRWAAEGFEGD
jgi:hypothetical protein